MAANINSYSKSNSGGIKIILEKKLNPKGLVKRWSAGGIEKRSDKDIESISHLAKHLSLDDVKHLKPNQLQVIKSKHMRHWSIGRKSEATPKMSMEQIEGTLKEEKHQNHDDLFKIGRQLTEEQRKGLFGGIHEELYDGSKMISEDSLKMIPMVKELILPLMITIASAHCHGDHKVGKMLIAMTSKQRKSVVHLIQTAELAYAIQRLEKKEALELYLRLNPAWRYKVDLLITPKKIKELYPDYEQLWEKTDPDGVETYDPYEIFLPNIPDVPELESPPQSP